MAARSKALPIVLLLVIGGLGWAVWNRINTDEPPSRSARGTRAIPVEVATIRQETISLQRRLSGSLEPFAETVVAPKIPGIIETIAVDIADGVHRGTVVARLNQAEHEQAVREREADVAVARAELVDAESRRTNAERDLERIQKLRGTGVASESELDAALAANTSAEAATAVARASIRRAEAALQGARVRLNYTDVQVTWTTGDDHRLVAERHLDEGDTVAANEPVLRVVEIDPVLAVVHVPEQDYPFLRQGLDVAIGTEAFPGETFEGTVERIAPIFADRTRQSRVEIRVPNPDLRLKPGMFVSATVTLDTVDGATVIPLEALASRDEVEGIFLVNDDRETVRWQKVTTGVRDKERVEIVDPSVTGDVVTLGQQFLKDGSRILIRDLDQVGGEATAAGGNS